jgi:hypothetical protein
MRVNDDQLVQALQELPTPEPSLGFVDRAIRNAAGAKKRPSLIVHIIRSWETWCGVAFGALAATLLALGLLRPTVNSQRADIALHINEVKNVDVIIDSERDLTNATIRVATLGGVRLQGFEDEQQLDWTASLQSGANVLTLPVLAHSVGSGAIIAMIEYGGGQRSVTVNVRVRETDPSKS